MKIGLMLLAASMAFAQAPALAPKADNCTPPPSALAPTLPAKLMTGMGTVQILNRERRSTLVLVTHDEALTRRADRVVTLRDGRIVSDQRAALETTPAR